MTQEQKDLLLKDLCGRLPYGVEFRYKYINNFFHEDYATSKLEGVLPPYHIMHSTLVGEDYLNIEDDEVRPYLFPLLSMTEEQRKEFNTTLKYLPAEEIDIWTRDTYDWCDKKPLRLPRSYSYGIGKQCNRIKYLLRYDTRRKRTIIQRSLREIALWG